MCDVRIMTYINHGKLKDFNTELLKRRVMQLIFIAMEILIIYCVLLSILCPHVSLLQFGMNT